MVNPSRPISSCRKVCERYHVQALRLISNVHTTNFNNEISLPLVRFESKTSVGYSRVTAPTAASMTARRRDVQFM